MFLPTDDARMSTIRASPAAMILLGSAAGALIEERAQLRRELTRPTEAVAAGGSLSALVPEMQIKEVRVSEIGAQLEHVDGLDPDIRGKPRQYQTVLLNLCLQPTRGLAAVLHDEQSARQILSALFPNPITVSPAVGPDGKVLGWIYKGEVFLGALVG